MAKTTAKTNAVAIPNVRNDLSFGQPDADLAAYLGLNLTASADARTEQALQAYNHATRHMVEAGLLLASVKADLSQEDFMAMLEERGLAYQRAYELMRGAALAARLPEDQRAQVLALPKTKVLALANASPAVVEAMLEDGDADINLIGVRELRQRIKDLEANLADTQVQRDTAETEAEGLKKKLAKTPKDRADAVPLVVADLRAEGEALGKKAELAIGALQAVGAEAYQLTGGPAHDWAQPTLRLALARACALRVQLDGVIGYLAQGAGARGEAEPPALAFMTAQEMLETAQSHARLVALHEHEKALREWERQQGRPRGKGRPAAKPQAPEGA